MDTIFWQSPSIESCNWIDFIYVVFASLYHWKCDRTQRKAATINQLACPSWSLYDLKLYMEISHSATNNLQLQLVCITICRVRHGDSVTKPDYYYYYYYHIHIWSEIWQMQISHSKYNILTIGRIQDHNNPYLIGNNPISKITSVFPPPPTTDKNSKFCLDRIRLFTVSEFSWKFGWNRSCWFGETRLRQNINRGII